MGDVASLVTGALRHKLTTHGVGSLTRVEWQLLRVSTLLHALDDETLERLLGDAPLAEVTGIADGLDAIGASEASTLVHYTVREIRAANAPGLGPQRTFAIREITERLHAALEPMRAGVEQQLLDFAFQQPELMPEAAPPAPARSAAE
jgi:hypothetical protein